MPVADVEMLRTAKEVIPGIMSERFEIALQAAEKSMRNAVKDVRRSAEDLRDEAERTIKRHPLQSVAIGFGVGAIVGGALAFYLIHKFR